MKFNAWSRKRRELGIKNLTSRGKPHTDDPDVQYIVGPLPWGFIRDYLWKDEGAVCPEELQRVINQIHRRTVPDDKMLYVHVLKKHVEKIRECKICKETVEFQVEETDYGYRFTCPECDHGLPVLSLKTKPTLSGLIQGEGSE